jgi:hypothetical protein
MDGSRKIKVLDPKLPRNIGYKGIVEIGRELTILHSQLVTKRHFIIQPLVDNPLITLLTVLSGFFERVK